DAAPDEGERARVPGNLEVHVPPAAGLHARRGEEARDEDRPAREVRILGGLLHEGADALQVAGRVAGFDRLVLILCHAKYFTAGQAPRQGGLYFSARVGRSQALRSRLTRPAMALASPPALARSSSAAS